MDAPCQTCSYRSTLAVPSPRGPASSKQRLGPGSRRVRRHSPKLASFRYASKEPVSPPAIPLHAAATPRIGFVSSRVPGSGSQPDPEARNSPAPPNWRRSVEHSGTPIGFTRAIACFRAEAFEIPRTARFHAHAQSHLGRAGFCPLWNRHALTDDGKERGPLSSELTFSGIG